MTLGKFLDKWLNDFLPGTIRQTTLDGYRRNVTNYIKPNLGEAKLAFITTNDIQKMYNKLKKNGRIKCHPDYGYELADSTVIKIHTTLHSAMEAAVKNHLIQKNPTDGTKLPKKKLKENSNGSDVAIKITTQQIHIGILADHHFGQEQFNQKGSLKGSFFITKSAYVSNNFPPLFKEK